MCLVRMLARPAVQPNRALIRKTLLRLSLLDYPKTASGRLIVKSILKGFVTRRWFAALELGFALREQASLFCARFVGPFLLFIDLLHYFSAFLSSDGVRRTAEAARETEVEYDEGRFLADFKTSASG